MGAHVIRPILFSGSMIRALIAGTKTQTRRVIRDVPEIPDSSILVHAARHPAPYLDSYCSGKKTAKNPRGMSDKWCWWTRDDRAGDAFKVPYVPGDLLWVRETFATDGIRIRYAATDDIHELRTKKPGIHMPRALSRLTLEVTNVRVERLQDITDVDSLAEGCRKISEHCYVFEGTDYDKAGLCHSAPSTAFMCLWDQINGARSGASWSDNPWVAAISFEAIQGNVDAVVATRAAA